MSSSSSEGGCAVCVVINERRYRDRTEHGVVFEPDNKLCEGHLIVAPLAHVSSALANPVITAQVMRLAAMRAKEPCTIVIPIGAEAQQMQPHMYVVILPADVVRVDVTPRRGSDDDDEPRQSGRKVRGRGNVRSRSQSDGRRRSASRATSDSGEHDDEAATDDGGGS